MSHLHCSYSGMARTLIQGVILGDAIGGVNHVQVPPNDHIDSIHILDLAIRALYLEIDNTLCLQMHTLCLGMKQ